MGASCVRDCERTTAEAYASEDTLPGHGSLPGLTTTHLASASSNPKAGAGEHNAVPIVPNWFQAIQRRSDGETPRETPRFEEATPMSSARNGGASARLSPRPPDEGSDAVQRDNEISYEGQLLGSKKHGIGRLKMKGSTYEGNFRNDLKHGVGVLTWDDRRQYRGQFEDGKFHGTAVMLWPDGRRYSGSYAEDKKHGEGTFSWQDGRRYRGQWVAGKRHGVGVYTNAKGVTRTGQWQMDRPVRWEDAPDSAAGDASAGVGDASPPMRPPLGDNGPSTFATNTRDEGGFLISGV